VSPDASKERCAFDFNCQAIQVEYYTFAVFVKINYCFSHSDVVGCRTLGVKDVAKLA
jgi:hypothetical protein